MITSRQIKWQTFNFPGGEKHVKIQLPETLMGLDPDVVLEWKFENNEEIIELMLIVDAVRRTGYGLKVQALRMPYVPFARQDRAAVRGEPLSIKVFADLINSLDIPAIYIDDPHSEVTPALLNNVHVRTQATIFAEVLRTKRDFWLICPDAGAQKKIYDLAAQTHPFGVVEFSKHRDVATGKISGVHTATEDLGGRDCYIVDDICDGGRTFTEIAKVLKTKNPGDIVLLVTHGLFTKGLGVFDGLIDFIYDSKGIVK